MQEQEKKLALTFISGFIIGIAFGAFMTIVGFALAGWLS